MHARLHGHGFRTSLCLHLPLLATALLATRAPAAEAPRPALDVEDAAKRFTPPMTGLLPLTLEPGSDVLELVERRSGVDRARLERARLYVGSRADEPTARVVTLPLGGELEGVSVALVIDDEGRLQDGLLWGRADVDEDPNGTWRRVVEQFAWAAVEVRDPAEVEPDLDPEAYWRRLSRDASAEARWTRALYEIRRRMIGNSAFYQEYELTAKRGETPPGEWFASYLASFDRLRALGDDMRPFLGEEATASFRESAKKVRDLVADMASAAGPDRAKRVSRIFSRMQGACFSCHDIRNHELGWEGPLVFPGLADRLAEQGVRDDLFRVGMDVWSPAGEEAAAQEIADAVQAALFLVGSSR